MFYFCHAPNSTYANLSAYDTGDVGGGAMTEIQAVMFE